MLDARHFQLLLDCDRYLERQHVLLARLAATEGADVVLAAMDSAFDQFLHAVTVAWRAMADELADGPVPDRVDLGESGEPLD